MSIKGVSKIWVQGGANSQSSCLVIPKKIALQHGLTDDAHVVVESTEKGILIRKLEI